MSMNTAAGPLHSGFAPPAGGMAAYEGYYANFGVKWQARDWRGGKIILFAEVLEFLTLYPYEIYGKVQTQRLPRWIQQAKELHA